MSDEQLQQQIIQELKRIREALAKPAPAAPEPPKGVVDEFIHFLNKYGVVGLAIAFIMGSAVNKLVSALVNYMVMPVITFFIPQGGWREATLNLGPVKLLVGEFAGALLDFFIISFVVFSIMKQLQKTNLK